MLERQRAPPEATQGPSNPREAYNSAPPLSRVSSILPPSLDVRPSTPTGADAIAQRGTRDRPAASRKEKKRSPRTVQSVSIDLKAELRTQSEKAAVSSSSSSLPSRQPAKRNVAPSGAQVTPSKGEAPEMSPASAPAYSSAPDSAQSLASATKVPVVGASAERGGNSAGSSGGGAGLEGVAAGARAALQQLDLDRVSSKMQDFAGQVKSGGGREWSVSWEACVDRLTDGAGCLRFLGVFCFCFARPLYYTGFILARLLRSLFCFFCTPFILDGVRSC